MTDFAALAQSAVDYMADNSGNVEANTGAAFPESKILRAIAGVESSAGRSYFGYAYQQTLLRGVPEVVDRAGAYNFTHIIFFATDFGSRVIDGINQAGFCAALEQHVVTYADDIDVLGEMLICAKCVGHWSASMDAALQTFTDLWTALDRNSFAQNYHPILIGGILFAMLARQ